MQIHRRAAAIVATEGFSGLVRRGFRKLIKPFLRKPIVEPVLADDPLPPPNLEAEELARQKAEFPRLVEDFQNRVRQRGLGDVNNFYWYHTVDLGDGLVTPGDYDFRGCLAEYQFPESMRGWKVLDVGSATGFFAFEFERRGANVVSVDLPSLADWDLLWNERGKLLKDLMEWHQVSTPEQVHWRHLEGPFQFCHRQRGSRVRRCHSRIYDLTPEKLGLETFDLVFLGDILGHLFSPLQALNVLAPLCRRLILSYDLATWPEKWAVLVHDTGEGTRKDSQSWFQPNWECLERLLRRLGFHDVQVVGRSRVLIRRAWCHMNRHIIHAHRDDR